MFHSHPGHLNLKIGEVESGVFCPGLAFGSGNKEEDPRSALLNYPPENNILFRPRPGNLRNLFSVNKNLRDLNAFSVPCEFYLLKLIAFDTVCDEA